MRVIFLVFIFYLHGFGFEKLFCFYGDDIVKKEGNFLYFKDGSRLIYDDKKNKTQKELLENADIEDSLQAKYPALQPLHVKRDDSSRVRDTNFLKKLYGNSKKEVEKNLVFVKWLPTKLNQNIRFNKKHNAAKALNKVSKALDNLDEKYLKYLDNIGGTFQYRNIARTSRLSTHSFGIAIDINVKSANYWQWNKNYKNQIPEKIVHIFEKHGFVWGGRWEHFDTMHFEYRPEIILTCKE